MSSPLPKQLIRISALDDNYIWLLHNPSSQSLAVIDPGDPEPVFAWLDAHNRTPTEIINTHHHGDHINGNAALMARFNIPLTAPASESSRINNITHAVKAGDRITIADYTAEVIATPGHTSGHVAFYLPDCLGTHGIAFVGDTLFALGCGRVFEGSMQEMWESLKTLRALPDDTLIACGHEYTENNARYVRYLGWNPPALATRLADIDAQKGEATLPVRLGDEKATNPFLNADDADLARALNCTGTPIEVFTALRQGKDQF